MSLLMQQWSFNKLEGKGAVGCGKGKKLFAIAPYIDQILGGDQQFF